jgi:Flp pilus assembly protein TadD
MPADRNRSCWSPRCHEEAANAAHKAVQSNPAHSISYMLPAAPLAKHGRLEESKAAAAQLIVLTQSGRGACLLVAEVV